MRICAKRVRSAAIIGTLGGTGSTTSSIPCRAAIGSSVSRTSASTSPTPTGSAEIETPPASMRERSRMSSMSRSRCSPPVEDLVDALLVALGERLLLVALEQLREPQDGVERRAELVAHRRQELALGGARRFRRGARLAQLLGVPLVVRQIPDGLDDPALGGLPVHDAEGAAVAQWTSKARSSRRRDRRSLAKALPRLRRRTTISPSHAPRISAYDCPTRLPGAASPIRRRYTLLQSTRWSWHRRGRRRPACSRRRSPAVPP